MALTTNTSVAAGILFGGRDELFDEKLHADRGLAITRSSFPGTLPTRNLNRTLLNPRKFSNGIPKGTPVKWAWLTSRLVTWRRWSPGHRDPRKAALHLPHHRPRQPDHSLHPHRRTGFLRTQLYIGTVHRHPGSRLPQQRPDRVWIRRHAASDSRRHVGTQPLLKPRLTSRQNPSDHSRGRYPTGRSLR